LFFIYSCIYLIAIIVLFPVEYFKRPSEIRKKWLNDKLGLFDSSFITHPSSFVWVHAVSVGEVMAASPLLKKIRERFPEKTIMLSTITDTGRKVAWERAPEGTKVLYLPFDLPFILNRVLSRVKPELLIVIETELWPNLISVFRKKGIPVLLLNGRISEKSFKGYLKISFFMKKVLSFVDFFGMQGEDYAERIRQLGADSKKVKDLGNFKFDMRPPAEIPAWTKKLSGPVITAGSTHDGEEELIVGVYLGLKEDFPDLNLIIAPRHPERFSLVEEMLRAKGVAFVRRSALDMSKSSSSEHLELKGVIVLLDTVGELSSVYGISDIAVIGKSFRGYGGQNPLEPAYWGKPIICGPHMENFPIVEEFFREGAAIRVREENLRQKIRELLRDPEKAEKAGSMARLLYKKNAGAVEKALEIIEGYISSK
jgi:3-deoxy-D-manno-octulosonic-acid transferase